MQDLKKLNFLLVDDEPNAILRFKSLLNKIEYESFNYRIENIYEAESGTKAIPLIYSLKPDIVFLDIQMPGLNGFEVLDLLTFDRPHIVFVTAYDEFALKAFEVHALDYLTKPVNLERLEKTIKRFVSLNSKQYNKDLDQLVNSRESQPLNRLTVHDKGSLKVIKLDEINRIEAEEKYVYIYLDNGKFRTDFTLDYLESRLDIKQFIRVHRSHIVKIDTVKELIPWFSGSYVIKLSDNTQLPIARRRLKEVKSLLGG
jgi:DNA-binding LytR/AlgR family response regulator